MTTRSDDPTVGVDLVALLRRPGTRRDVSVHLTPVGTGTSVATVDAIDGTLVVESHGEKVGVTGRLAVAWHGECRRCLGHAEGSASMDVQEIYEKAPVDGETYELPTEGQLDLAPMLVEQALLSLPLAPLCGATCAGPAPETYPTAPAPEVESEPGGDPRWAALDALVFDDEPDVDVRPDEPTRGSRE